MGDVGPGQGYYGVAMQTCNTNGFAPQREKRSEAYRRIEALLEKAGPAGVHRAYFLYTLHWSQIGARISEMNDAGWVIRSVELPRSQWSNGIKTKYVLDSKPLQAGQDWYVHATGQSRPSVPVPATSDMPLFRESSL